MLQSTSAVEEHCAALIVRVADYDLVFIVGKMSPLTCVRL